MKLNANKTTHHAGPEKVYTFLLLISSLLILSTLGGCVKIPMETSKRLIYSTRKGGPPQTSDTWLSSNLKLRQKNKIVKATLSKKVIRQTTQISEQYLAVEEKAIFAGLYPGLLSITCGFDRGGLMSRKSKEEHAFHAILVPPLINVLAGIPSLLNIIIEPFCEYGPGEEVTSCFTLIGLYKNTKTSDKTETGPELLNTEELSLPCRNETVTLTAPMLGKTISARTDNEGGARFDLLQIAPAGQSVDIIVRAPKANIPPDEVHMKVSIPETE